jgi:PAS domain S-box-containing protein
LADVEKERRGAGRRGFVVGGLGKAEKPAERGLGRQDAILEAVRFAAERFLSDPAGWERGTEEVLTRLGEAAEVSRVYVFENYTGEDGRLWNTQRHKWEVSGVPPGLPDPSDDSWVMDFPYHADETGRWVDFGRWEETLGRGDLVYGNTRDFPESERPVLIETLGIMSMILVPIFVGGRWWGFIGFDDCFKERDWSAEIDALKAAASTLGAAVQRQAMEEELRGSEARYRAVIEQATDGIYLLDADTKRVVESNPAFQRMLGYTDGELEGMEVYDFVDLPRESMDARIRTVLESGRRIVAEREYLRRDGSPVDVEVGVSVISLEGRDVICTIVRDVTERKRAQERLRQLNEELEERVRRRTTQLEAANRELEAFSYSVSHDLKAPLRAIDGFSQILLEDYSGELDEEGRGYLRRVRDAGSRMALLIEDLLTLSKVTRADMRRERVDLSALAREVAAEIGHSQPEREVAVEIEDGLFAEGDARLLRVMLENLLGNAWKFTSREAEARVWFGASTLGGTPVYFVEDNGVGFDVAYADKLFGAFQRLHGESEFEGTGVGLSTVQRIVYRHGGRIWAEGAVGKGATFYFTLSDENRARRSVKQDPSQETA